jgi:TRAP-type C4-dicarboxylate transport system substrate-binding protein
LEEDAEMKLRELLLTLLILTLPISASFADLTDKYISWTGCGISKKAFMTKMAKEYEKKSGYKFRMSVSDVKTHL